jgi:hypothetical protein
MRKLTLDPEALQVESFAPRGEAPGPRGTVRGHVLLTDEAGCSEVTCHPSATGVADCLPSCDIQYCRLTGVHPTCVH